MGSMGQGDHLPHPSPPSPLYRQPIQPRRPNVAAAGSPRAKDLQLQLPSSLGCSSPCSVLDNPSFRSPRFSPQFRFSSSPSSSSPGRPGVVGLAILVESEASPPPGEEPSPSPRFGPVNRRWADYGCFSSNYPPRNPTTNSNSNSNTSPSPGHSHSPSSSPQEEWIGESESPNPRWQRSPPIWIGSGSDLRRAKHGQRRIFSTGSPISGSDEDLPLPLGFLQACFFCKLPFRTGKDIYMYRGDRGFCSVECRERQILMDEEKTSSSMKKKVPHDTTNMAAGA